MADNFKVNQKLENENIRSLLEKRQNADSNNKEDIKKIMNDLIYEIVFNTGFLSPVNLSKPPVYDASGELILAPDTEFIFTMLDNGKGERFFPLFTESEELAKWEQSEAPYTIQMDFDRYASMLERNISHAGIVINPFSDNLLVNRQIVAKWYEKKQIMQKGHAQHIITPDSEYAFFTLDPYPTQMADKLRETAKNMSGVKKLWLRGVTLNGSDDFLLIVDFSGDRLSLFSELGNAAKPFLEEKSIHIISLDEGFGKRATENETPIYSAD